MKTYNLFFALLLLITAVSCEKNDETPSNDNLLQDDEVIELLSGAILNESSGILSEVAYMGEIADDYQEKSLSPCDISFDTLATRSYNTSRITSNYTSNWGWKVLCNDSQIPNQLTFSRTTQGNYETNRMTSNDQANSSWLLDNLLFGGDFILNGQYQRTGTQQSLVRAMNSFASTIQIELSSLSVNKTSYEITSGVGSYSINVEGSGGNTINYTGALTFLGNQQATLILNGVEYNLDWN